MELTELLKWLFDTYGAPALLPTVAAFLGWLAIKEISSAMKERRQAQEISIKDYQELMGRYHDAIVQCTRSMERLSVLIEERTARQRSR